MSGSGKSYWSAKLAQQGFRHFDCDRLIASRLEAELTCSDGAVVSMGEWMGFPYQKGYREREAKYLAYEKKVLREIFETIQSAGQPSSNIVIDTTGSVIYTGKKVFDQLRRHTTVVHLQIPAARHDQMLRAYLANPRPVLWQGKFVKKPAETIEAALARCYSELMAERERLYEQYAHVTIAYHRHRNQNWKVADFLDAIKKSHP